MYLAAGKGRVAVQLHAARNAEECELSFTRGAFTYHCIHVVCIQCVDGMVGWGGVGCGTWCGVI